MKTLSTVAGIIFGYSVGFYIIRQFMIVMIMGTTGTDSFISIITGTTTASVSENMLTYLVPLAILASCTIAIFFTFYRRRPPEA